MRISDIDFRDILLEEESYKKHEKYFNLWHFIQIFYGWKIIEAYIKKKVVRHIDYNLSDFSYSDESDGD